MHGIKGKLTGGDHIYLIGAYSPSRVLRLLMLELWISRSELIIRDVAIDVIFMQILHVGFVGKTGIGGDVNLCTE